ncbi:MAG: TraB/GumN family protein [Deltaproteobacteria bacterium]|nr:TraB/GumN family protein [Deltaproteobacteria bacterium]MBW1911981.1 TraB/GumN family protein [Deltaproteobacteria bacterium]
MIENGNRHRLTFEDKEIILIGTAHVSRESADLAEQVIEEEKPDTVCVELCQSRYKSIMQKNRWQNTDLLKVIREKKAFLLLSNLMLAHFQKKIGQKLGIKPGEEIMRAIRAADSVGARIHLADRDIHITLSRTWRLMGLWTKMKLLAQFITSVGDIDTLKEEDIERMKRRDVLETLLSEIGESLPEIKSILIDERDQYLAHKIRTAPGKKIVAVVGAGHVPGIQSYWDKPIDMEVLEQIPPKGKLLGLLKWGIPVLIVGLIVLGFFTAGAATGTHIIKWWILINATLAGLGAAIARGHPLTVLSAIVASPFTSLNPMIAAGWVSGLVETLLGKPKVRDFENLSEDISSLKGFWKNKITRILLVVVFTNVGSSLGTFVAIPLMVKILT